MGIDFQDVSFRLEKLFGVRIEAADWQSAFQGKMDFTVGELHDLVVAKCKSQGVKVPRSSWNRVRVALCQVSGTSPKKMRRETLLLKDLEFY
jgi:hypothetical protein